MYIISFCKKLYIYFFFSFYFLFLNSFPSNAMDLEKGKILFLQHCISCHENGNNFIIPEKNLYLQTLKTNGIEKIPSLLYQIINGKNGMPAFGGRLSENDLIVISFYVLEQKDW